MNKVAFLVSSIVVFLTACNQDKMIKLKENDIEKMTYYASKKRGYRISILKHVNGLYMQYAVRLNEIGEVLYVYKTPITQEREPSGTTEYLVTDTDTSLGARFFNREIIGFYASSEMNFISDHNYKGKSSIVFQEEKKMFNEIDLLMKQRKLSYIPFDITDTLFWFKYDLL